MWGNLSSTSHYHWSWASCWWQVCKMNFCCLFLENFQFVFKLFFCYSFLVVVPLVMILIWPNAFIVDFVKKLVLLMLLSKDRILNCKLLLFFFKKKNDTITSNSFLFFSFHTIVLVRLKLAWNCYTTKRNCWQTVTNGRSKSLTI